MTQHEPVMEAYTTNYFSDTDSETCSSHVSSPEYDIHRKPQGINVAKVQEALRKWKSAKGMYQRRGKRRRRSILVGTLIVLTIGTLMLSISAFLLLVISARLAPPTRHNGLQVMISNWTEPGSGSRGGSWASDFSRDVVPLPCHSHNDYWRRVPLLDALSVGCTGVEADIWFHDGDLMVGHTKSVLNRNRTLRTLYIEPLIDILTHQNSLAGSDVASAVGRPVRGIFDTSPYTSLILLLDMKTDGHATFEAAQKQLQPLRDHGWLTHYDGHTVVPGPITVVGTGNTPFDLIAANATYRDVFYDAPLNELVNEDRYNATNSLYASVSLKEAVGRIPFSGLSGSQMDIVRQQIATASSRGLMSRYWGIPGWPVSLRNRVWRSLVGSDVGMLNVDDLSSASRWNWDWCIVLGVSLCG